MLYTTIGLIENEIIIDWLINIENNKNFTARNSL